MSDNEEKIDIDHLIRKCMEKLVNSNKQNNSNIFDNLIKWLSDNNLYDDINENKIHITDSFLNSVKLIISEFTVKKDILILEKFYDKNMLNIFELFELDIKIIGHDDNGILIDEVEEILKNRTEDKRVFFYLNPFNNIPSLNKISEERIQKLNDICNYDKFWVISNETNNIDNCKSLANLNPKILSIGNIDKNLDFYWIYNSDSDIISDFVNTQFVSCNLGKYEAKIFNEIFNDLSEYKEKKNNFYNETYKLITKRLDELDVNYKINNTDKSNGLIRVMINEKVRVIDYNKNNPYNFESLTFYYYNYEYDFNYIIIDLDYKYDIIIREIISIKSFISTVNSYKLGIFTDNIDFLTRFSEEILKNKELCFYRKIDDSFKLDPNMDILICNSSIEDTNKFLEECIKNNVQLPLVLKNKKGMNKNLISEYLKNGSVSVIGEAYEGRLILKKLVKMLNKDHIDWKKITDSKNNNYIFESKNETLTINHIINDKISESLCYVKHINLLKNEPEISFYVDFEKITITNVSSNEIINVPGNIMVYSIFEKNFCILDNDTEFLKKYESLIREYKLDFVIDFVTTEGIYGDMNYTFSVYTLHGRITDFNMYAAMILIKYLKETYNEDKEEVTSNDYSSDFEFFDTYVKVSFPYNIETNSDNDNIFEEFKKNIYETISSLEIINVSHEISIFNIDDSINIVIELDDSEKDNLINISYDSYILLTEIIIDNYKSFLDLENINIIVSFIFCEINSNIDNNEIYMRSFDYQEEINFNDKTYMAAFEFFKEYYVHSNEPVKLTIISNNKSFVIEYEDGLYINMLLSDIKKIKLF